MRTKRKKKRKEREERKVNKLTLACAPLQSSSAARVIRTGSPLSFSSSSSSSSNPWRTLCRHERSCQPVAARSTGYIIILTVPRKRFLANGTVVLWDSGRCPHRSHASWPRLPHNCSRNIIGSRNESAQCSRKKVALR